MPSSKIARILLTSGYILTGGFLLSALTAWLHMRELVQSYGVICGSGSGVAAHCSACYASALFLATGAPALMLAQLEGRAARLSSRSGSSA